MDESLVPGSGVDPQTASEVAQTAVEVGALAPEAADSAAKAVEAAETEAGLPVEKLKKSRAFLFQALIDNSGSMQGFESPVRKAFERMKEELSAAAKESDCEVLMTVSLLNGGVIQPYVRVGEALTLSNGNHVCSGDTPFFQRAHSLLGGLILKVKELTDGGLTAQTFTAFISDGKATDRGNPEVRPEDLHDLLVGLTETKQHIICGVSIGSEADVTFAEIGIQRKWILDPEKDEFAFEAAINKVSRASRSASKSAGAFQSMAGQGFTADGATR